MGRHSIGVSGAALKRVELCVCIEQFVCLSSINGVGVLQERAQARV